MKELILEFYNNRAEYFGNQNKRNRDIVVKNYSMDMSGAKWKDLILGLVE
jgi:hypothetical protein